MKGKGDLHQIMKEFKIQEHARHPMKGKEDLRQKMKELKRQNGFYSPLF